jgi:hypothetical protein
MANQSKIGNQPFDCYVCLVEHDDLDYADICETCSHAVCLNCRLKMNRCAMCRTTYPWDESTHVYEYDSSTPSFISETAHDFPYILNEEDQMVFANFQFRQPQDEE